MKQYLCTRQSDFGFSRMIETHLMRLRLRPLYCVLALFSLTGLVAQAAEKVSGASSVSTEIIVDRASADIFPEVWLNERINAKAEPLDAAKQRECREIVSNALAKYPAPVLSAHLKKVYVLGGLSYSGVSVAGTRSKSAVYVVRKAAYSAAQVEGIVHAEFSSILLQNSPNQFDKAAWQRTNPADFQYRGSGVQAVRSKQASLRTTDELCEEGFLNEYSKASIEEDFNSYASRLLMGDTRLWTAIEQFPKVKAKAELAMSFYAKLDAAFTREFFMTLRAK